MLVRLKTEEADCYRLRAMIIGRKGKVLWECVYNPQRDDQCESMDNDRQQWLDKNKAEVIN